MVEGDPGWESIFGGSPGNAPLPSPIGATGAGDGGHWMTGPIYVCGAEPGDVLQVRAQMQMCSLLTDRLARFGVSLAATAAAAGLLQGA